MEKNNLGVINGCYVPCLLNILGAVLYLRIGFGVGMMGMFGCSIIFIYSELIAYLTTFSFSAIVTNGEMKGGGAYYMISRNLGPAFGASSGLLFWFTYCITVTFNAVAWTETFLGTFSEQLGLGDKPSTADNILCSTITLFLLFLVAYKGAGTFAQINVFIFICLVLSLVTGIGSIFFLFPSGHKGCPPQEPVSCTQANAEHICVGEVCLPTGFCDVPALAHSYAGEPCKVMHDSTTIYHDPATGKLLYDGRGYFYSLSIQRMKDNMWPKPVVSDQCGGKVCTLNNVFGVIFPAITGMMEGCNLSGDLKDPAYAIPYGTLAAVTTAFLMYMLIIVGNAGSMNREAMQYDMNVMQHSCVNQYLVVLGVAAACLSTCLGSMFGSARILQAIARDDIIPILSIFKKGTKKGDEPRNAVIMTYFIAQCGIFIGGLDKVGPILTNFYLIVYTLVNLATVLLELADLPNFRPPFKYYSWQASLFGAVATFVTMFYMQPLYAVVTVIITGLLFVYIALYGNQKPWGDISQAMLFNNAKSFLLRLQKGVGSTKFWQPSLLLIADDFESEHQLVHFCNDLKKGGVLLLGQALLGDDMHRNHEMQVRRLRKERRNRLSSEDEAPSAAVTSLSAAPGKGLFTTSMTTASSPRSSYSFGESGGLRVRSKLPGRSFGAGAVHKVWALEAREQLAEFIGRAQVDAFPQVMVAPTARVAYQNLVISAGLGSMVPDTVVVPMPAADGFSNNGNDESDAASSASERFGIIRDGKEYVHMLRDVFDVNKNIIVAANFGGGPVEDESTNSWQQEFLVPGETPTIDVWIWPPTDEDTDLREDIDVSLLLQLSYVLMRMYKRSRPKLRVIQMVAADPNAKDEGRAQDDLDDLEENLLSADAMDAQREAAEARLRTLLKQCRMDATALCVLYEPENPADGSDPVVSISMLNKHAKEISANTKLLFMTLPPLPSVSADVEEEAEAESDLAYLAGLGDLVDGLPPVALVGNGQGFSVITTEI